MLVFVIINVFKSEQITVKDLKNVKCLAELEIVN